MYKHTPIVISAAALVGLTLACSSKSTAPLSPTTTSTSPPADGSTLKASAPVPQSPTNDVKLQTTDPPTLVAGAATTLFAAGVPLQYRFQVFGPDGGLATDSGLVNATSWRVNRDLEFNKRHTWRVRAEAQGNAGPWSATASFITPEGGFIRGNAMLDPLTNGKSVGQVIGGHFVQGQGWQADGYSDAIDYDIPLSCGTCTLEFDVTNVGKGLGNPADLKFVSMGDPSEGWDFIGFRNNDWKMSIEQRGDGDGTAMKLIWRINGEDDDHNTISPPGKVGGPNWQGDQNYHFTIDWNPSGYSIAINGEVWFDGGFDRAYLPPNWRIELGCAPRGETQVGAIWRNVKLTPH